MRAAMAGIATTAALAAALGAWGCGNSGSSEGDGGAGGDTDGDTDVECAWRVMMGPEDEPHEGHFGALAVCGPNQAYVVAGYPEGGIDILGFSDGQWSKVEPQPTEEEADPLADMVCLETGQLVMVGADDSDLGVATIFDGESWAVQDLPEVPSLRKVWADSPDNIYASGDDCSIVHYNGAEWEVEELPEQEEGVDLRALCGCGEEIFAAGYDQLVVGEAWVFRKSGGSWQRTEINELWTTPLSLWCDNQKNNIYMSRWADKIGIPSLMIWEDGEWKAFEEPHYSDDQDNCVWAIENFWGKAITDLYGILSLDNELWHRTEQGWELVFSPEIEFQGVYPDIERVRGSSGENVFATGNGIYRYSCE